MKNVRLDHATVNAVFTTDWHLSDQPPGSRTGNYREQILAKVRFANELAHRLHGVHLQGGDVYHTKDPKNRQANTFALQTRLEEECRQAPTGTLYGTHGNHDLLADRVESLSSQPLGTLIASGAFTDLSQESIIFENVDGSVRVQVDAYPYTSDDLLALDRIVHAAPRAPGVHYRVVLMHQYGNPGNDPSLHDHPIIGFNRMAECDYDVALWGHDHSRVKPVQVGNTLHVRLGSLSRASLAEDEVDRPIAAAVLSFGVDKVKFREVVVPVEPLAIAFTAADKPVEKVMESDEVTEFFASIQMSVAEVESSNPREVLYELCPAEERSIADLACECCGL